MKLWKRFSFSRKFEHFCLSHGTKSILPLEESTCELTNFAGVFNNFSNLFMIVDACYYLAII